MVYLEISVTCFDTLSSLVLFKRRFLLKSYHVVIESTTLTSIEGYLSSTIRRNCVSDK